MEKVNENRQEKLLPKQCFELAGGTSTGGLIALMLFRLGMDTQEAIDIYRDMAKNVFSPRLPDFLGGWSLHKLGFVGYALGNPYLRLKALLLPSRFSDYYLKAAIDDVMRRYEESGEDKLRKSGTTPMFMCATSISRECAELFRSYPPPSYIEDKFAGITVKDAALATSAAPTYLPIVKVNNEEFWDGGLLHNNPINQVWNARYDLVPITDSPKVRCVVSIGTGLVKKPVQQPYWGFFNTVSSIISYATNTESKHKDFERKMDSLKGRGGPSYFRFNVELEKQIKLDDWQKEQIIVQFILDLDSRGFPSRLRFVEEMANSLLADCHASPVGKRWAHNFVKRQPELKTRLFRKYDYQRAKCEDPTIIRGWFRLIQNTIAKYSIRSDDIWNFDETGFMMGLIMAGMAVTGSETQGRPKSVQPGNREWITVIQAINAEGQSIAPFIVGAGQYHLANWYRECNLPGDWVIATSQNGWTNNELGLEWLKHFDQSTTNRSTGPYRLLILDGHESHHSADFGRYCQKNKIITLSTDPNASQGGHSTINSMGFKDPKDSH
ncbi:hypothetical protein FMUND_15076 [Fusarium mundagurra]|uniref:PNPLA domain-containing protein n=1 Tax=Fusarium mundagurra TaxID=1567541 RepID=A0A8H5XRG1_9HYPO|nr:hypothetical protein FMUND_15076 [Fusarium mundagurra]